MSEEPLPFVKRGTRLFVAAALLFPFLPIRAQSRKPVAQPAKPDTKEAFDRAETVVYCEALANNNATGPGGATFTFYTFKTIEAAKGIPAPTFRLRLLGSSAQDHPAFHAGTGYVLMLGPKNRDGFPTLNSAAIYVIEDDPGSGRKLIVPGLDGVKLYDKESGRLLRPSPDRAYLDDFLFSLKKSLQKTPPLINGGSRTDSQP